jgi:dCMP deaminase
VKRPTKIETMLEIAGAVARRSTCARLQVGTVITDRKMEQIAVGYNGGPRGGINRCRRPDEGNCGCVHSEINALLKANFPGDRRAFVTDSPCPLCAVALVNGGVVDLVYAREYRDPEGLEILAESGVGIHTDRFYAPLVA